ncbi:ABC-type branched-subunit amino acid transport system substrate-binding protein [Rhodoligotrophos appendicifer]|uniref:ABC transporter substrate-binding protein n=1 Tax=Rhodoligotrophos appendicifer TaxID=987056 RepID=UPI0011857A87|nr:ABC transporter substrate-binding protein [Rhodoligotrophos appendicifer]
MNINAIKIACRMITCGAVRWLVTLGLALSLAATAQAEEQGVTKDEIVLGGVFALSGPVSLVTNPYGQAIDAYFKRVNDEGGINGRKIKWIVEDDAYKPAQSLAAAKKLIERDNVFFIFGQMGASMIGAVSPYVDRAGVPAFGATAAPDPQREHVFSFMAPYPDLMYIATKYLLQEVGAKRIAFLYQNDDFGELGRVGVMRAMNEAGVELAADIGYERGTSDFSTYALKIRDSQADTVISMGVPWLSVAANGTFSRPASPKIRAPAMS